MLALKTCLPFLAVAAVLVAIIAYLWRELQRARKALDGFAPVPSSDADAPVTSRSPDPPPAKRQHRVRFAEPDTEAPGRGARSSAPDQGDHDLDEDAEDGLEDVLDGPEEDAAAVDHQPEAQGAAARVSPRAPR